MTRVLSLYQQQNKGCSGQIHRLRGYFFKERIGKVSQLMSTLYHFTCHA